MDIVVFKMSSLCLLFSNWNWNIIAELFIIIKVVSKYLYATIILNPTVRNKWSFELQTHIS